MPTECSVSPVVFVVDDDPSVRRALCRQLRVIGFDTEPFASASDFLERKPPRRASCLVLDVRLPGLSGLDLQEELVSRGLGPAVVFITGFGSVPESVRAMKNGAIDFLEKPFAERDLLEAVQKGIESDSRNRVMLDEWTSLRRRYTQLTPREGEVFELVVSGLLNKQVASRLGTSEKTIKVHRGRVMRKMGAESLADLVRKWERLQVGNQLPGAPMPRTASIDLT